VFLHAIAFKILSDPPFLKAMLFAKCSSTVVRFLKSGVTNNCGCGLVTSNGKFTASAVYWYFLTEGSMQLLLSPIEERSLVP